MTKLNAFIEVKLEEAPSELVAALRKLNDDWGGQAWSLQLRVIALVIADLLEQGWKVKPLEDTVELLPPGLIVDNETIEEAKARLRRGLKFGRASQLSKSSVRKFIRGMQLPSTRSTNIASVSDLVDSGAELADAITAASKNDDEAALEQLANVIDPIVEVCERDIRCSVTGHRLTDIWRYFRHTWSLEYRSIPGRKLPLLIRNAARPNRPVIGIAMLASPVLRTKSRDQWIGWNLDTFVERLRDGQWDAKAAVEALVHRVETSIEEICWDDLAHPDEIYAPTERTILRLEQRGAGAAAARSHALREQYALAAASNEQLISARVEIKGNGEDTDWKAASEDLLFVRKRAETLAQLLRAKLVFGSIDRQYQGVGIIDELMRTQHGKRAIATALQELRKAGLSSRVVDVSVCGAVAPYGELLGGKLVALLMASAEVRHIYQRRYSDQISIISSQMAGRPVCRPADLKLLTTTSLYGVGSSQYNRLRLTATRYPALGQDLHWQELDEPTAGYGTVHLSAITVSSLQKLSEREHQARRINRRFGEGASPRLRQVREGLDALGVNSDSILHHATPRLVYGCKLGPNAFEELLGLCPPDGSTGPPIDAIAAAWRERWLLQRGRRPEVIDRLRRLGSRSVEIELMPMDERGQLGLPLDH